MRCGDEHRKGWSKSIEVDGETVRVEARHHTTLRVPRGNEIVQQYVRGRPWKMVEDTEYEWAVIYRHRLLCTMRQAPNGDFHVGAMRSFPRLGIAEAAAKAARHFLGTRRHSAVSASPDAEDGPAETGPKP